MDLKIWEVVRDDSDEARVFEKEKTFVKKKLARRMLRIGSVKLNSENPFEWASGYRMPIYNDNRMLLGSFENRLLVADGFMKILADENVRWYGIAGTSTSGIPPATTLADLTHSPLIYVRDKPKPYGLRNQIEGIDTNKDLEGKKYILIEDVISTGGSSARVVQAIRDANGICNYCLSVFNYGFRESDRVFEKLEPSCVTKSLLTYKELIEVAEEVGYINNMQVKKFEEWGNDPFGWGEKHGFPLVEI